MPGELRCVNIPVCTMDRWINPIDYTREQRNGAPTYVIVNAPAYQLEFSPGPLNSMFRIAQLLGTQIVPL
jgi:hypothetical protein